MQPAIVNQISHFPIALNIEPDFSSGGQTVVGVVLVVFIVVAILADAFSVQALVLELLADVSGSSGGYFSQLAILEVLRTFHILIILVNYIFELWICRV